ncbi:MAG: hypothetical protein Q4G46_09030, partial [Propionibacteriaceae bacterium]|nr:hypothetical protein [Propionibacteriaceae bacterium]
MNEPPATPEHAGAGGRACDPVTGWDRATVIHALAAAARREREARIDQLVLIARAAEVWSWIDNIDHVVDAMSIDPDPGPGRLDAGSSGVGERLWQYGADGSPEASEFLRFEVGPALGISPDAAAVLIGNVLDLRHRLPGLWAHIEHDQVPGWVGCKVAELTRAATLTVERCRELDRQLALRAPGLPPGAILNRAKRLISILDPASTEARRRHGLAARFVQFYPDRDPDGAGTLNLRAQLNGPEGLDLEATINALADVLDIIEPDTTRPVLRAKALELLADPARAAAILTGDLTTLTPDLNPDASSQATAPRSTGDMTQHGLREPAVPAAALDPAP